jgi:carbon storage regulator
MLVLSRKRGERIVIGGSIEVTVVTIRGTRVRLAIDAPLEVRVHRGEIHQRLVEEKNNNARNAESGATKAAFKLWSQESESD